MALLTLTLPVYGDAWVLFEGAGLKPVPFLLSLLPGLADLVVYDFSGCGVCV